MKKLFLASAAVIALAAGPANAADLAARSTYKAPPPPVVAPVYSWSGFYAGVSLGGRWSDTTWTTACITSGLNIPCDTTRPELASFNPSNFNSSTFRAGGYFGYNWQLAPSWLVGVEGDIAWGDSKKTIVGIPGTCLPSTCHLEQFDSSSVKEGWDASIRGRLGFLISPTVLLYGTGGIAWQELEINARCIPANCNFAQNETVSWTKAGWTVGGGVEAKFWSNWLGRLEYRYADYGQVTHTFFASTFQDLFGMKETLKTHTVLVGLAYQFGWGKAPVVARY